MALHKPLRCLVAFTWLAAVLASVEAGTQAHPRSTDLTRAKTRTPRKEYQGAGSLSAANLQLNKHLQSRQGTSFKACEDFSVDELRLVLKNLFSEGSDLLRNVYAETDGRRARYSTIQELENHWSMLEKHVSDVRVRDAHCHEAVMWYVHHLTEDTQSRVGKSTVLPLLPLADHRVVRGGREASDAAGTFYDDKVTCQACHVGGVDSLGLPEEAPKTQKAKQRRCYSNYKALFNITCEPCDGIAGYYWGDSDDHFTPPDCAVVAQPEDVPTAQRVLPAFPSQFSVDVVWGADRFGRTTNPVKDALPSLVAKLYGEIHGKWYMDAKSGGDVWLLRHDTVYAKVFEDGIPIPFIAPSVTEIHAQTAKMRKENVTGPMVSLINGMPSFLPGGCSCIPDPVGVPDASAAESKGLTPSEMEYLGRVRLQVEKLNTTVELDHWANWFFHVFMETDKSVPHYGKAPRRIGSAYAGVAVYDNWVFADPKVAEPDVWTRGIPTEPEKVGPDAGKYCMNAKKVDFCENISQSSFPPKHSEDVMQKSASFADAAHPFPFMPSHMQAAQAIHSMRQSPSLISV
mmetsp:Transcript_42603/g.77385  ORF Transcript_42603/g.77385 Transcript_42603/m.77385 type:complete len:571 (+) Transcript_42603:59-1771(+)